MSSKAEKIFQEYLKRTGGRSTKQKKTIITGLCKLRSHFDIEDFITSIRKKDSKGSRATVYRVMKELLTEGFIQKITTKDGKVFYEHNFTSKHHDHIICNSCGKIFEMSDTKIDSLLEKYCQSFNFEPEYRSLHIYGTCEKCQNK